MQRRAACLSIVVVVAAVSLVAQAPKKHFLWAITSADAPPTYLMGSMHLLTPDFYPLSPVIEQAFARSKVLIEEVDLDELRNPATALPLLAKAMYTDGTTLDKVIAPDLYKQVTAHAEKAGIPVMAIQRMKPWMAAVSLIAPALKAEGFNTELGVDKHFFDRAKKAGMETRALETVVYQFDRLDQMAPRLQEEMLRTTIRDLETQVSNVKSLADAWARGETGVIERIMLGSTSESPELYDRLLVERNRNWVEPVEACIKQKTACFVVVGAAHLVGPDSLVALLRKKGYAVEQQ
jgi:uncharacterized protein YbaP (TraB family)